MPGPSAEGGGAPAGFSDILLGGLMEDGGLAVLYGNIALDGCIVKSGPKELALELEAKGYDWLKPAQVAA